jgi:hypothetical protein
VILDDQSMYPIGLTTSDLPFVEWIMDQVARPKLWRTLSHHTPLQRCPIDHWETEVPGLVLGVPSGWTSAPPDEFAAPPNTRPLRLLSKQIATDGIPPAVTIIRLPGPATRQQLEASACAAPRLMADRFDDAVPVAPANWIDVGGEPGIAATVRYRLSGRFCRHTTVTMIGWGVPHRAEFMAGEDLFDEHFPDFETMLATWRWWDGRQRL